MSRRAHHHHRAANNASVSAPSAHNRATSATSASNNSSHDTTNSSNSSSSHSNSQRGGRGGSHHGHSSSSHHSRAGSSSSSSSASSASSSSSTQAGGTSSGARGTRPARSSHGAPSSSSGVTINPNPALSSSTGASSASSSASAPTSSLSMSDQVKRLLRTIVDGRIDRLDRQQLRSGTDTDASSSSSVSSSSSSTGGTAAASVARRLAAATQLRQLIDQPAHQSFFAASYDTINTSLERLLEDRGVPALSQEGAILIGRLATVLRDSTRTYQYFYRHMTYLSTSTTSVRRQQLYLVALDHTFGHAHHLRTHATATEYESHDMHLSWLLPQLLGYFETITDQKVLVTCSSLLRTISRHYGDAYAPHFENMVDIMLGWALQPTTSMDVRRTLADLMQQFGWQWHHHIAFTAPLVSKLATHIQTYAISASAAATPTSTPVTTITPQSPASPTSPTTPQSNMVTITPRSATSATPPASTTTATTPVVENKDDKDSKESKEAAEQKKSIPIALMACFSAILSGLVSQATPSAPISLSSLTPELVSRLLTNVGTIAASINHADFAREVNSCIRSLCRLMNHHFLPHYPAAMALLHAQLPGDINNARALQMIPSSTLRQVLITYSVMVTHLQTSPTPLPSTITMLFDWPVYGHARLHSNAAVVNAAVTAAQSLVLSQARTSTDDTVPSIGLYAVTTIVRDMKALSTRLSQQVHDGKSPINSNNIDIPFANMIRSMKDIETLLAFNAQVLAILPRTYTSPSILTPSSLLMIDNPSATGAATSSTTTTSVPSNKDVGIQAQMVIECFIALYSPYTATLLHRKPASPPSSSPVAASPSSTLVVSSVPATTAPVVGSVTTTTPTTATTATTTIGIAPQLQLLILELLYTYHPLASSWQATSMVTTGEPSQLQFLLLVLEEQCRQCTQRPSASASSTSTTNTSGSGAGSVTANSSIVYHAATSDSNIIRTLSLVLRWLVLILPSSTLSTIGVTHLARVTSSLHLLATHSQADIRLLAARTIVPYLRFLASQHEAIPVTSATTSKTTSMATSPTSTASTTSSTPATSAVGVTALSPEADEALIGATLLGQVALDRLRDPDSRVRDAFQTVLGFVGTSTHTRRVTKSRVWPPHYESSSVAASRSMSHIGATSGIIPASGESKGEIKSSFSSSFSSTASTLLPSSSSTSLLMRSITTSFDDRRQQRLIMAPPSPERLLEYAMYRLPLSTAFKAPQFTQVMNALAEREKNSTYLADNEWISIILHTAHAHVPSQETEVKPVIRDGDDAELEDEHDRGVTPSSSHDNYDKHHQLMMALLARSRMDARFGFVFLLISCAKYLIRTTLKSPIGQAKQTLGHLGALVIGANKPTTTSAPSTATPTPVVTPPPTPTTNEVKQTNGDTISGGSDQRLNGLTSKSNVFTVQASSMVPLRSILLLLDLVEKFIFNAHQGSVSLPSADEPSIAFFRANARVCESFFNQIRTRTLQASMVTAWPTAFISNAYRHCESIIRQFQTPAAVTATLSKTELTRASSTGSNSSTSGVARKRTPTMDAAAVLQLQEVMYHLSRAMAALHDSDSLEGLYQWVSGQSLLRAEQPTAPAIPLSVLMPWFRGMTLQARGHLERALREYCSALPDVLAVTPSLTVSTIVSSSFKTPNSILPVRVEEKKRSTSGGDVKDAPIVARPEWAELNVFAICTMVRAVTTCLMQLSDWIAMDQWCCQLASFKAALTTINPGLAVALRLPVDLGYIRGIAALDTLLAGNETSKAKRGAQLAIVRSWLVGALPAASSHNISIANNSTTNIMPSSAPIALQQWTYTYTPSPTERDGGRAVALADHYLAIGMAHALQPLPSAPSSSLSASAPVFTAGASTTITPRGLSSAAAVFTPSSETGPRSLTAAMSKNIADIPEFVPSDTSALPTIPITIEAATAARQLSSWSALTLSQELLHDPLQALVSQTAEERFPTLVHLQCLTALREESAGVLSSFNQYSSQRMATGLVYANDWNKMYRARQTIQSMHAMRTTRDRIALTTEYDSTFVLQFAHVARKQTNIALATRLMLRLPELTSDTKLATDWIPAMATYERALLSNGNGARADAFGTLWKLHQALTPLHLHRLSDDGATSMFAHRLASSPVASDTTVAATWDSQRLHAKCLLKISGFLDSDIGASLHASRNDLDGLPDSVAATQQLCLRGATQLSPESLKAWFRYGRWCNRRAAAIMRKVNMPVSRHHRTKSTKPRRLPTSSTSRSGVDRTSSSSHAATGTGTRSADTQSVRGDSGASGSRRNSADAITPHPSPPHDDDHDKATHGTDLHTHDWESKGEASYLDEEKAMAMEKAGGYDGPDDGDGSPLRSQHGDGARSHGTQEHDDDPEGDELPEDDGEGDDLDSKDSKEADDHVSTPGDSGQSGSTGTGEDDEHDDDGEDEGDDEKDEEAGGQDGDQFEQAGAGAAEDEVVDDDDKERDAEDDDEFGNDDEHVHHHHHAGGDDNHKPTGSVGDGKTGSASIVRVTDHTTPLNATDDVPNRDARGVARAPTRIDGDALRLVRLLTPHHQSLAVAAAGQTSTGKTNDTTSTPTRSNATSGAGSRRTASATPIPINPLLSPSSGAANTNGVAITSYHSLVGPAIHGIANPNDIEMEVAHSSLLRSIHAMLVISVNGTLAKRNFHPSSTGGDNDSNGSSAAAVVALSPSGMPVIPSIVDLLRPMVHDGLRKISETTPASATLLTSASFMSTIVDLAVQRADRLISYHRLSARCYFRVLTIQFGSQGASTTTPTDSRDSTHNRDYALSVPLLVLRLLTEYGTDLADVLSDGLASTPPSAWLQVVPLLFARLCHPNPVVRDQLCLLLARIGQRYPHVIVFRMIVDRQAALASGHTLKAEQLACIAARIDTGLPAIHRDTSISLTGAFGRLMDEVSKVVTELNRVALLWEDTWLAKVRAVQAELPARIKLLVDEIELINQSSKHNAASIVHSPLLLPRSASDTKLDATPAGAAAASTPTTTTVTIDDEPREVRLARIRKSYQVIMEPIMVQLADLRATTIDLVAETPHEEHFQRRYGALLTQLQTTVASPAHPENPSSVFRAIDPLLSDLKRAFLRLSLLELRDISPFLHRAAAQRPFSVPLAGLGDDNMTHGDQPLDFFTGTFAPDAPVPPPRPSSSSSSTTTSSSPLSSVPAEVCLHSFSPSIEILRTKTRPKKLVVLGWDGRYYRYLLKAREDLHLDERMMHFLQAVNRSLGRDHTTKRTDYLSVPSRPLLARTYPVVPLSDKAGLIRWVDNVTPLFDVYRKWASRAQAPPPVVAGVAATANPATAIAQPTTTTGTQPPPANAISMLKPTELYAQKVRDYLMERGLSANTPRAQWPREILVRVFHELASATPKELLARELWCTSPSPAEWWRKTGAFTSSVAVMSMIGYMVGLGDRHLGNMMADFATGQIVHIDYNICFDRGRKLPIPELVPFRLTQIMEEAFGMTGVRGAFANSCQQVMAVMRRNAQTLVSLLDTFVYDPIVDWVPADRKPESRRRRALDQRMALTLSSWRMDKNHDILTRAHQSLETALPLIDTSMAELQHVSSQLAMVNDDALTNNKLPSVTWLTEQGQSLMVTSRNDARQHSEQLKGLRERLQQLSSQLHESAIGARRDSEAKLDTIIGNVTNVVRRHDTAMIDLAGELVPNLFHKFAASVAAAATAAANSSGSSSSSDPFSDAYFHLRNLAAPLTGSPINPNNVSIIQRNCSMRDIAMGKTLKMLKMGLHRTVKMLMLYRTLVAAGSTNSSDSMAIGHYSKTTILNQWLPLLGRARAATSPAQLQTILDEMNTWRHRSQRNSVYNDHELQVLVTHWIGKRTSYHDAHDEMTTIMTEPFQLAMTTTPAIDTITAPSSSSSSPATSSGQNSNEPAALQSYTSADHTARSHVASLVDSLIASSARDTQAQLRASQLMIQAKRAAAGKAAPRLPAPPEHPQQYAVDIICNLAWLQIVMDLADQVTDIYAECGRDHKDVVNHINQMATAAVQAATARKNKAAEAKVPTRSVMSRSGGHHHTRVVKGIRRKPTVESKEAAGIATSNTNDAVIDDDNTPPSPLARLDVLLSTMIAVGDIGRTRLCTIASPHVDSVRLYNHALIHDCIGVVHRALQLPHDFTAIAHELVTSMQQLVANPLPPLTIPSSSSTTDEHASSSSNGIDSKRVAEVYEVVDTLAALSARIRALLDEMDQLLAEDVESAIATAAEVDPPPSASMSTPSKGPKRGANAPVSPAATTSTAGGATAVNAAARSTFAAVLQRRQRDAERARRRAELSVELRALHMAYRRLVDVPSSATATSSAASPSTKTKGMIPAPVEVPETKATSTSVSIAAWLARVDTIINTLDQSTVSFRANLIRSGVEAPAVSMAGVAVAPFSASDVAHLRIFLGHRLQIMYEVMTATLTHVSGGSSSTESTSVPRVVTNCARQLITTFSYVQMCPLIQSVLSSIVDQQLQSSGSPATGRLPSSLYLPRHRPGQPLPSLVQVPLVGHDTNQWALRKQLLTQTKAFHHERESSMNDIWRLMRNHFSLNAQLQFAQRAFNKRLTAVQATVTRCETELRRSRLAVCGYAWQHTLPPTTVISPSASSSSSSSVSSPSSLSWSDALIELLTDMGLQPSDIRLPGLPVRPHAYQLRHLVMTALNDTARDLTMVQDTLEKFEATSYSKTEDEVAAAFYQCTQVDHARWNDVRERCHHDIHQRRAIVRKQLDQTGTVIALTNHTIDMEHYRAAQLWITPPTITIPSPTASTSMPPLSLSSSSSSLPAVKPLGPPSANSAKTMLVPPTPTPSSSSSSSAVAPTYGITIDTQCSQLVTSHQTQCARTSTIDEDIRNVTTAIATSESLHTTGVANVSSLQKLLTARAIDTRQLATELHRQWQAHYHRHHHVLQQHVPSLRVILDDHVKSVRELRPLLGLLAKSTTSLGKNVHRLRMDMDRLQRGVATLLHVFALSSPSMSSASHHNPVSPSMVPMSPSSPHYHHLPMSSSIMSMPPLTPIATSVNQLLALVRRTVDVDLASIVAELDGSVSVTPSQQVEERNRYAVQVVKRVRQKLAGIESDTGDNTTHEQSAMSVAGHVEWMLTQATSVDNLSRLYEGWAPWI